MAPREAVNLSEIEADAVETLESSLVLIGANTLYPPSLDLVLKRRTVAYLVESGWPQEETGKIIDQSVLLFGSGIAGLKKGMKPQGVTSEVDLKDCEDYVYGDLDYARRVPRNSRLFRLLKSLPRHKVLLSYEHPPIHIDKLITALGLGEGAFHSTADLYSKGMDLSAPALVLSWGASLGGVGNISAPTLIDRRIKLIQAGSDASMHTIYVGEDTEAASEFSDRSIASLETLRQAAPEYWSGIPFDAMNVKALFFDMDDTLYPKSTGIWETVTERIGEYMIDVMKLPKEHVPAIMDECYKQYGMTLAGLRKGCVPAHLKDIKYTVDERDFLAYVHNSFYDRILPNPELRKVLLSLPLPKYILSNSDEPHIRRTLSRLGISDCFDGIIDIFALDWHVKPSPLAYEIAMDIAGVTNPSEAIFFDDSPKNIKGSKAVGMWTALVGGKSGYTDPYTDFALEKSEDLKSVIGGLWSHVKQDKEFLQQQVKPVLVKGLTELVKNEGHYADPISWLAKWLLENNARTHTVGTLRLSRPTFSPVLSSPLMAA